MSRLTKKQKSFAGKVYTTKLYPFADALKIVKECATAKFDESIDVAVQLGIDAKKIGPSGARRGGAAQRHGQNCSGGGVRTRCKG